MAHGRTSCRSGVAHGSVRRIAGTDASRLRIEHVRRFGLRRWSSGNGPIAQSGQSRRLITGRSQVRILVGPLLL